MVGMTRTIARGYAGEDILCFGVAPGFTVSEMTAEYLQGRGGAQIIAVRLAHAIGLGGVGHHLTLTDEEVDQLLASPGIRLPQPCHRLGQLEYGGSELSGGVDSDHVVWSASHQEGSLEAALVEAGCGAEGGDGGSHPNPLGEVDEQIRGPAVDLLVGLLGDHRPVRLLLDVGARHGGR